MKEKVRHMDEIQVYRDLMNILRGKIEANKLVIEEAEYENELYQKVLKDIRTHTKQLGSEAMQTINGGHNK